MLKGLEQRFTTRHQSFDGWLLLSALALMLIGWVMVTSASTEIAASLTGNPYYFSIRHGIFVLAAIGVGLLAVRLPLWWWREKGPMLLILGLALLVLVLLVGARSTAAGAGFRWASSTSRPPRSPSCS